MNDLIWKQDALDAIDSWRREYPLDLQEPIDDCWNAVRELPVVEQELHWIPCSERLPEMMCCRCLVTTSVKTENVREATYAFGKWFEIEYLEDGRIRRCDISESVTAWMPLPNPYKGGDFE